MEIIDKAEKTLGKIQYHLRIQPGDVGKYVLLPGDPDRVLRIAKRLENAREIANNREFRTWTGEYQGITVSATSTGIGCPSAAIAVEELANVGATHFIRVGSTGAIQPDIHIGDLIITTGSMRNEGTTRFYVDEGFPAIPDHFLTHALIESAREYQKGREHHLHIGLSASDDAFYGEEPAFLEKLSKWKLLNVEMESAAIFIVAWKRGLKAAMICAVSGNLVQNEVIYEETNLGLVQGWEDAISVALEAIRIYEGCESGGVS